MANVVHNHLSTAKIRSLKDPGRYVDGAGLYLRMCDEARQRILDRGPRPRTAQATQSRFFTGARSRLIGDCFVGPQRYVMREKTGVA